MTVSDDHSRVADADGMRTITLNRPEVKNEITAFDAEAALEDLEVRAALRRFADL
jgi:hypothetical protein